MNRTSVEGRHLPQLSRRNFLQFFAVASLGAISYHLEKQSILSQTFAQTMLHLDDLLKIRTNKEAVQIQLAPGVQFERFVMSKPRPLLMHLVTIDVTQPDISFYVSPGDTSGGMEATALTLTEFLENHSTTGKTIAINANFFKPHHAKTFFHYYPNSDDPIHLLGEANSSGTPYSAAEPGYPAVCILPKNRVSFTETQCPVGTEQAVAGNHQLLSEGKVVAIDDKTLHPRTAIGYSETDGQKKLYLLVIDGRQPLVSDGVTLKELAEYLQSYGATEGINMDGGDSATIGFLENGAVTILNNPNQTNVWNRERPVGNFFAVEMPR